MKSPTAESPGFSIYSLMSDGTKENLRKGIYYVSPALGRVIDTTICLNDPSGCALKVAESAAYTFPKYAFESFISLSSLGARYTFDALTSLKERIIPTSIQETSEQTAEAILPKLYALFAEKASDLNLAATSYLTEKTVEVLKEAIGSNESTFKASHLIGPAIFLSYCANKTLSNALSTIKSSALLLTGTTFKRNDYHIPATNGSQSLEIVDFEHNSLLELTRDVLVEGFFTGLSAAMLYLTYKGIYNQLLEASGKPEHARMMSTMVLAGSLAAPRLLKAAHALIFSPQNQDSSTKSPSNSAESYSKNAGTSSHKVGIYPHTLNLSLSSGELSPEDAYKILNEYRKKSDADKIQDASHQNSAG